MRGQTSLDYMVMLCMVLVLCVIVVYALTEHFGFGIYNTNLHKCKVEVSKVTNEMNTWGVIRDQGMVDDCMRLCVGLGEQRRCDPDLVYFNTAWLKEDGA